MPKPTPELHAEIIAKIEQAQIGNAHMGYGELLEWIKGKLKDESGQAAEAIGNAIGEAKFGD